MTASSHRPRPGGASPSPAQSLPPDVATEHLVERELIAPRGERRRRRRRALLGTVGVALLIAGAVVLIDRASQPPGPQEVAERIHDAVQREAIAQTGDKTLTVGRLDCVQLRPGVGNCLADFTSRWRRPANGTMLAVSYAPDPRDGQLSWAVELP